MSTPEEYTKFADKVKSNPGARRCVMQALVDGRKLKNQGYEVRLSTGKYYKNPSMQHRWVEYKKGNDWYVYDTNHKVTGWKKSKLGKMYVETDDPIYDFE